MDRYQEIAEQAGVEFVGLHPDDHNRVDVMEFRNKAGQTFSIEASMADHEEVVQIVKDMLG